MTSDPARERAYAALVRTLLDTRSDGLTDGFDGELDDLVRSGAVTAEAAQRLRAWQRASVQAVADHAYAVLPAAMAALSSSQLELQRVMAALASGQHEANWDDDTDDTPGVASATEVVGPSSLEEHQQRLIVADLVRTSIDLRTDTR